MLEETVPQRPRESSQSLRIDRVGEHLPSSYHVRQSFDQRITSDELALGQRCDLLVVADQHGRSADAIELLELPQHVFRRF